MISSRCSAVNVNIGIPACGVVSATNKAVLVIPGVRARYTKLGAWELASKLAQRPSRDMASKPAAAKRGRLSDHRPIARSPGQLWQLATEELQDNK
jgi:hypothetical protein